MLAAVAMDNLKALLDDIWIQHLGIVQGRLALVQEAVAAFAAGSLDAELAREAADASHKLAGTLANFCPPQTTADGRRLEELFTGVIKGNPVSASELRERADSLALAIAERG